jgi:hypothetical protein
LDEIFYRTIAKEHAEILEKTKKLTPTTETFTSPTQAFSNNYDGVTYKFTMKDGTTKALEDIGVRDQSKLVKSTYPNMPEVKSGWNENSAFFKQEKVGKNAQINIGLGKGKGIKIFNENIISFENVSTSNVNIECK